MARKNKYKENFKSNMLNKYEKKTNAKIKMLSNLIKSTCYKLTETNSINIGRKGTEQIKIELNLLCIDG